MALALFRTLRNAAPSVLSCKALHPSFRDSATRCLRTWCHRRGGSTFYATPSWRERLAVHNGAAGTMQGTTTTHISLPFPLSVPVNTMKKKSAIKRRCKDCRIVVNKKEKRAYVICKTSPRHNQVQG